MHEKSLQNWKGLWKTEYRVLRPYTIESIEKWRKPWCRVDGIIEGCLNQLSGVSSHSCYLGYTLYSEISISNFIRPCLVHIGVCCFEEEWSLTLFSFALEDPPTLDALRQAICRCAKRCTKQVIELDYGEVVCKYNVSIIHTSRVVIAF